MQEPMYKKTKSKECSLNAIICRSILPFYVVAICGNKKVAIEWDVGRWYSEEEKGCEDMQCKTFLKWIGWRFIRIRDSDKRIMGKMTRQQKLTSVML